MATQAGASFIRRPYLGSCHCGTIKYVVYLTLPHSTEGVSLEEFYGKSGLKIYKCNCTVCQKMGIFHLRLASPADDFALLSPLDPEAEDSGMTKYLTSAKQSSWWFCKSCGIRCFTVRGATEQADVDLPVDCLHAHGFEGKETGSDGTAKVRVWKPAAGFAEKPRGSDYFSVNAVTLNPKQEGLDLALFHEKGWIAYVDSLDRQGSNQFGKPHAGGIY